MKIVIAMVTESPGNDVYAAANLPVPELDTRYFQHGWKDWVNTYLNDLLDPAEMRNVNGIGESVTDQSSETTSGLPNNDPPSGSRVCSLSRNLPNNAPPSGTRESQPPSQRSSGISGDEGPPTEGLFPAQNAEDPSSQGQAPGEGAAKGSDPGSDRAAQQAKGSDPTATDQESSGEEERASRKRRQKRADKRAEKRAEKRSKKDRRKRRHNRSSRHAYGSSDSESSDGSVSSESSTEQQYKGKWTENTHAIVAGHAGCTMDEALDPFWQAFTSARMPEIERAASPNSSVTSKPHTMRPVERLRCRKR